MSYDEDYSNNEEFLDVSIDEILEMYTNIENENKQLYKYIANLENSINESEKTDNQTDNNSESLLQEKDNEIARLKDELEELRENSSSDGSDTVQYLENELNKKIEEIKSLKNKIKDLEENSYGGYSDEETELLRSKNADLKEKLSALREENKLLKENNDNKNNDIINNEKAEELMAEINSLKQDNARLQSENEKIIEGSAADSESSEKDAEIRELKDKLAKASNSSDALVEKDNEINKLKARNIELEEKIKNSSDSINKSNNLLVELSAKINELEQEKLELSQRSEKLEVQLRTVIADGMKKASASASVQQISNSAAVNIEAPADISAQYIEQMYNDYISKKIDNLPEAFEPINLVCKGIKPKVDDNNGIPFYCVDMENKIYLYPDISIIDSKNIVKYNFKVYSCSFEGKARLIKPAVVTAPDNRGFISVKEIGQLEY